MPHSCSRPGIVPQRTRRRRDPTIPPVKVFNLEAEQEWDAENDRDGFRHRVTRVGKRLDAQRLGAGLYELPPGEKTWPYHFTYGSEEWLLVVSGRPTLRTPEGDRELTRGDVVVF